MASRDAEFGFSRPEMFSESLAGTAKGGATRHLFLVWGKADEWPGDAPAECAEGSLPRRLEAVMKKLKNESGVQAKWNLMDGAEGDKEGDILVFPDYLRFRLTPGKEDAGLEALATHLKTSIGSARGAACATDVEELAGAFAFVCGHAKRDERCAVCGPVLRDALVQQAQGGAHADLKVRLCSHVGGHKYAGNVLVYGGKAMYNFTKQDGHSYGYVTPKSVGQVLSSRAVCGPLWRGRLGVGEGDAIRERRWRLARDYATVGVTIAAVLGAVAWLRQKRRNA